MGAMLDRNYDGVSKLCSEMILQEKARSTL